jgi:hypothetical protein
MEWLLSGVYWAAITGSYTSADPRSTTPTTSPTDLDLWLIRLVYEVAAGHANCARCGAPLGRRLHLATRYAGRSPAWHVLVATRCRGWRRHRHTALVTEASNNLELGLLRPNRFRRDNHV